MMEKARKNFIRDAILFSLSLVLAIIIAKMDLIKEIHLFFNNSLNFMSLIGGMFFTFAFTSAPATVVLGKIAQNTSIWNVAIFGTLGAVVGDLLIFHFIKHHVSRDLEYIYKKIIGEEKYLRLHHKFHELHALRWLLPIIGAIVVASPLPDELGLMILGLAKVKARWIAPLTFTLNFFGILTIAYIARALVN